MDPKELKCPQYPESFRSIEYTPHIGIEFPDVNLVDWLKAPNSDEILYELALLGTKYFQCQDVKLFLDIARRANCSHSLVAERGVVFFRSQTQLNSELQKDLIRRLGQLSGRSKENGLYRHPLSLVLGETDPEISVSSETITRAICCKPTSRDCLPKSLRWIPGISRINLTGLLNKLRASSPRSTALTRITQAFDWIRPTPASFSSRKRQASGKLWHSDGIYETNPPDFSSLKLKEVPTDSQGTETLSPTSKALNE